MDISSILKEKEFSILDQEKEENIERENDDNENIERNDEFLKTEVKNKNLCNKKY